MTDFIDSTVWFAKQIANPENTIAETVSFLLFNFVLNALYWLFMVAYIYIYTKIWTWLGPYICVPALLVWLTLRLHYLSG